MRKKTFDRRQFLTHATRTGAAAAALAAGVGVGRSPAQEAPQPAADGAAPAEGDEQPTTPPPPPGARYVGPKTETGELPCTLCPRACKVKPNARGHCQAYMHTEAGALESLGYGKVAKLQVEQIETDHFFHVLPGAPAVFFGTPSCNLHCTYCSEWKLSQFPREKMETQDIEPQALVDQVAAQEGKLLGFTYTEPAAALEYATDVAIAAREAGIHPIAHTAGYMMPEAMKDYASVLSALNVDIKAYAEATYKSLAQGSLKPVLDAIIAARETNVWLELTYLVVPGYNNQAAPVKDMCKWVVDNCGPATPVHFVCFFPRYKHRQYQTATTPAATLRQFRETAYKEGLLFAYIGNVPGETGESTLCPKCSNLMIRRIGTAVTGPGFDAGRGACMGCGLQIPGIWQ